MRLIQHRPGYKITVANAKGGVGKSFVTTNLAGELAVRGYNVGIVDTDSQGNASLYLGVQPEDGLFKALVGVQQADESYLPVPLEQLVRRVPNDSYLAPLRDGTMPEAPGALYILPGYNNTFRIPYLLSDTDAYSDMLDTYIDMYDLDFIFTDTAPTLSFFDASIYDAADGFLFVTECAMGSMQGLADCYQRVRRKNASRAKRQQRQADIIGIIPNKFVGGKDQSDNAAALGAKFGTDVVFDLIKWYKTIEKASSYGQTVRSFSPNTPAALQILDAADRVELKIAEAVGV